jgi:hypothetical protein
MPCPTVESGSDSILFRLPVQFPKMRLEIGYMPRTHPHYPLDRDYLPMLTGDKPGTASPADLFGFGENQDCGKGTGQHFHLAVSCRRSNFKLVK